MANHIDVTRRDFLRDAALGVAGIAAVELLLREGQLQAAPANKGLHHQAQAKHVIHIFLGGEV